MRMAWWVFIALVAVQVILMQVMVEEYMGGGKLWPYVLMLGFTPLLRRSGIYFSGCWTK